jgi:hypothetical protein
VQNDENRQDQQSNHFLHGNLAIELVTSMSLIFREAAPRGFSFDVRGSNGAATGGDGPLGQP